jgi:hypothetical protein
MRNCIVGATPPQKHFRMCDILRKNRRNAEMPMDQGFLRCHNFCHGEKLRRDSDISRKILSHAMTPAQSSSRRKKILQRMRLWTC